MPDVPPRHRHLSHLTDMPSVAGREEHVIEWVERWVSRRQDVKLRRDRFGNLHLTSTHRRRRAPVIAVAHMDHPGFVVTDVDGRNLQAEFRGGVMEAYFTDARAEFFGHDATPVRGRVTSYHIETKTADIVLDRARHGVEADDLGRWFFPLSATGVSGSMLRAPACDDLAGVAAVLSALDRTRKDPTLGHFGVLLTRAEEEGLLGSIGAARHKTIREDARVISVETSRAFPESPIGAGPVVRVGDASSIFSSELTNRVAAIAKSGSVKHQRKLMPGGTCEATAFVAFGYQATGLCLPLGNYHNMADIDGVRAGAAPAVLAPEEIDLDDFDGLVQLLVEIGRSIDDDSDGPSKALANLFDQKRALLD